MGVYNFSVTTESGEDITDYLIRPTFQRTVGKATIFSFRYPVSAPVTLSAGEYITLSFSGTSWKLLLLPPQEGPHDYDFRAMSDTIHLSNLIFTGRVKTVDVTSVDLLAHYILYYGGAYSYIKPNTAWIDTPGGFLPDDTGEIAFRNRTLMDIVVYLASLRNAVVIDNYDSTNSKWYLEFKEWGNPTVLSKKKHITNYSKNPNFDIPPNIIYIPKHGIVETNWASYEKYGFWKPYVDNTEYASDEEAMRQAQLMLGGKGSEEVVSIEIDDLKTDIDIGDIVSLDGRDYIVTDITYDMAGARRDIAASGGIPPYTGKAIVEASETEEFKMLTFSTFILYIGASDTLNQSSSSTHTNSLILNYSRLTGDRRL